MMLGENSYGGLQWSDDHSSFPLSPSERFHFFHSDSLLQRYLQSNTDEDVVSGFQMSDLNGGEGGDVFSVDAHSCDHFRMYDFKVRKCARVKSHDWEECPFVHPGEKARRRDPRKFHYSGSACPDFRRGGCLKGDACEYAHGVFECWLHPARYRTQACKDGMTCKRRVCFFAHSPDQLRVLSSHGPESLSPPVESPPMSPLHPKSVNEVVASLRRLQLSKLNSMPSSWTSGSTLSLSPRVNITRPGFFSLPTTPTGFVTRPGISYFDSSYGMEEEEPVMERVESGRDLRAKMFEKLSKENPLDRIEPDPELGWVSEVLN